jgi:DNA-binding protein HU-beta
MNKAQLVEHVAKATGMTKRDAQDAVDATIKAIMRNTKRGGVQLAGFGSFNVVKRKGRMGRNPQTGEALRIKPSRSVRFRPGRPYKEMV